MSETDKQKAEEQVPPDREAEDDERADTNDAPASPSPESQDSSATGLGPSGGGE
jgi:hypothetical protein